jgi:GDP-4-dehydro-6-deoxy-D-mannose reductase
VASTILVTGATGFAGSHLLDRLHESARVIAWSREIPEARAESRVEWRQIDLLDRAAVEASLAADAPGLIYHLAGAPHVGSSFDDPVLPLTINAVGTHRLLSAVERTVPGARVLVVTSAMVYGASGEPHTEDSCLQPGSPYGLSKLAQDKLATEAARDGLQVVTARPFNHTGPRQDPSFAIPGFAQQIARIEAGLAEPVLRVGNLDAERDITDVRDVVEGYAVIAERGETGRAYNVCGGAARRIGDLLELLVRRSRVRIRVEQDQARMRPVELPRLAGDNSRLRALGWAPRVPVETMLDDVLAYWRTRAAE